jgi:putative ABC transport system permease protein
VLADEPTANLDSATGAAAMLVFGAYSQYDLYVLQTSTVARTGHLQVYRKGFFDFGSGNPAIWGVDGHRNVLRLIRTDPVLAPMIAVATPVQFLTGIASNPTNDESKTFFATGFVPSDLARMERWNEYGARDESVSTEGLSDDDPALGVIGIGFARILGLCAKLHVSGCPDLPSMLPGFRLVRQITKDEPCSAGTGLPGASRTILTG